jgi:hypothetical protein
MASIQKQVAELGAAAADELVRSDEAEPAAAIAHLRDLQDAITGLQGEADRVIGLQRTFKVGGACSCWPGLGA